MMDGQSQRPEYRAFLEAKVRLDRNSGFEVDPAEVNPRLKELTRAIVPYAVWYLKRAEAEAAIPSLFDLDEPDQANDVAAE